MAGEDGLKNIPVPLLVQVLTTKPAPEDTAVPANPTLLVPQELWSTPALAVNEGLIVIVMSSLAAVHGPAGSFVVKVKVTVAADISEALGV